MYEDIYTPYKSVSGMNYEIHIKEYRRRAHRQRFRNGRVGRVPSVIIREHFSHESPEVFRRHERRVTALLKLDKASRERIIRRMERRSRVHLRKHLSFRRKR